MRSFTRNLVVALTLSVPSLFAAHAVDIYPNTPDAKPEIQQALATAKAEHKRVILDFGGNWCGDCKALNIYFHQPPNDQLLAQNFVLVDVNIGRYDMNLDVAEKYGIPLKKGVPALAVIAPDGKLLHAQSTGEFENMRNMEASSVTDFLNEWKPKK
jgi:thioredoxin 1